MISEELNSIIIDEEVNAKILKDIHNELVTSKLLLDYVEEKLLIEFNAIIKGGNHADEVTAVIAVLFAQAVKCYKSILMLLSNGYYSNSIILIRNLIEVLFNIKYILVDSSTSLQKAKKFLNYRSAGWKYIKISQKALETLDRPLYEVYGIFSNYTHTNYLGAVQNFTADNEISVFPTHEKVDETINCVNSIFYHLLTFLTKHYDIDMIGIDLNERMKQMLELYEMESIMVKTFAEKLNVNVDDYKKAYIRHKKQEKNRAVNKKH